VREHGGRGERVGVNNFAHTPSPRSSPTRGEEVFSR